MPDAVLAGRYAVGDVLGRGGMAIVYRGHDRVLGRDVAIKVLAPGLAGDPDAVERFGREATAAAALNHPGIVTVFDSGSEGGHHFIVMELVDGRTLASILAERGSLRPETALTVAARVADALSYAHVAGVVHRDVKPGNIMVSRGLVKVMDFGIARVVFSHTITETAAILGTASYLAPEQAQGGPVDARSDVYALGAVLYQMLAGRPPFVGDSPVAVAVKHVSEEPVPPSEVNDAVPAEIDVEVLRALAKDPDGRHASAAELARNLDALRGGLLPGNGDTLSGSRRPPGNRDEARAAPEPILGRPWRRIAAVAAAAILAVLGVGFLRPEAVPSSEDRSEPRVVRPTGRPDGAQEEGPETQEADTATGGVAPGTRATPSPSPGEEDPAGPSTGDGSDGESGKEPPEEPAEEPTEDPSPEPTEDPTEPPPPPSPSPGTAKGLSGAS